MKTYIGTKQVAATPMTRAAYNDYRGWLLPEDEDGADEGYLVEYLDGGKPNHKGHAGYISWSPKAQFDAAYLSIGDVSSLAPHQQRVAAESKQLIDKIDKLHRFFVSPAFSDLHEAEQSRLHNQARFMQGYAAVLQERIHAFDRPVWQGRPK